MKKLFVVGHVWPEPKSSAAGSRMMQLFEFFLGEEYQLYFGTTASPTAFSEDLVRLKIKTYQLELNSSTFDDLLQKIQPEIVLFDRFMTEEQFGWRVSEICPDATKILDTEDLHFLRKFRQENIQKEGNSMNFLKSDLAKREIASIYRCDLSLIISEAEIQLLKSTFSIPEDLLLYLPFMLEIPSEEERAGLPHFKDRRNFVSLGNFLHNPNYDAVLHLKREIWPLIRRQLPSAEIHIFGAYTSEKVMSLNSEKEGFLIKGRADCAAEVLKKARILLAPLRFGAGLKGKFTDAMLVGTPSVTTSVGAEGMGNPEEWNGKIADKSSDFAEAAVELYSDEVTWQQAQEKGFQLPEKKFKKSHFSQTFAERLRELILNLEEHRITNFTGAMLQHHTMQSKRYLSKYIEAKNRLEKS